VLHVKLVNASNSAQPLEIMLDGKAHKAAVATLHGGSYDATNSIADPEAIVPKKSTEAVPAGSWKHDVPGLTIQVIDIPLR
jgi:alpha-N-arabinofuranosidase